MSYFNSKRRLGMLLCFSLVFVFLTSFYFVDSNVSFAKSAIEQQGPESIGEEIFINLESPEIVPSNSFSSEPVWTYTLSFAGATYICPHFSEFSLPEGAKLVIRSLDGKRKWSYEGKGENDGIEDDSYQTNGFWGIHIGGEDALIELYSTTYVPQGAVKIDSFARGFTNEEMDGGSAAALCGEDDSGWAACYKSSEPDIYNKAKAVARIVINGTGGCTAWLVGSEGHVMTNNHCIKNASDAANTSFEFMAEGATCNTDCATSMACSGTVVATSSTLVKTSGDWDYTLAKLPVNASLDYGYLQLRSSGPTLDERIYIPQHPKRWGKKIAVKSTDSQDQSGYCEIYSLNEPKCGPGPGSDIGYFADTQGGSSGSPVLGYKDHLVVSLHHCGTCPNRGVPIKNVIDDLGASIPKDALPGPQSQYSLNVVKKGQGSISLDPPGGKYDPDTQVTITATPASGWKFDSWSGDLSGNTNPGTVTMVSDKNVTATFIEENTPGAVELSNGQSVSVSGNSKEWKHYFINVPSGSKNLVMKVAGGTGDIDLYTKFGSQPTETSWDCRPYKSGNAETCTVPNPETGKYYVSAYMYAASSNASLTASYDSSGPNPQQYTLVTNVSGQGTVSLNPPGGKYDKGTRVELTANPETGNTFSGWSGDLSGSANPSTITMNADKRVTATFKGGIVNEKSCEGNCGGSSKDGTCYCDSACSNYGDCCEDKVQFCGY